VAIYGLQRTDTAGGPIAVVSTLTSLILFTTSYATLAIVDYTLTAKTARQGPQTATEAQIQATTPT
jgi:cytochrome bd-type quinol oxidase subunit 1